MNMLQQEQEQLLEMKNAGRRNGGYFEPLRHHRYKRKAPKYFHSSEVLS